MSINDIYPFSKHKSRTWGLSFLGLLTIIIVVVYIYFPSAYNQGIYHYQGLILKNGGLPYSDFIEKKGPMGLLTYSLASVIFGENVIAYRIFDLIILVTIGVYLFRFLKLEYPKLAALFASIIWLSQILIDGPGNTADVTNIITACYVILSYHIITQKKKNYYLVIGILIALACWVKPTALIIGLPIIILHFTNYFKDHEKKNVHKAMQIVLGMCIPTLCFSVYLFISGTFIAFWEAVVLDTLLNYADNVSRFSYRMISKTGATFLQGPIFRIGGLLSLFLLPSNRLILIARTLVIGVSLMLFVEGRLYPYHFSILWPFLALGIIHGYTFLMQKLPVISHKTITISLCVILAIPTVNLGSKFIKAGGLTSYYDAGKMFLYSDFLTMFRQRESVVSYLKDKLVKGDEIYVLGIDPNIYLELNTITTCRFARDGYALTKNQSGNVPNYLMSWRNEMVQYMQDQKSDWIIVLKELPEKWDDPYVASLNHIFSIKYQLMHETEGHLVYRKIEPNE